MNYGRRNICHEMVHKRDVALSLLNQLDYETFEFGDACIAQPQDNIKYRFVDEDNVMYC